MAVLAIAFAAAAAGGSAVGVLAATLGWVEGVQPRRLVREHVNLVTKTAFGLASAAGLAVAISVAQTDRLQAALGPTCAAAAFLLAIAAWVLAVEPEDEGEALEELDEPKWWPQFERDLTEWRDRMRVPVGPRR
jgi:hypothetical protein